MNSLHTELKEETTSGFSCKIKKQCFEFYDFLHPEDVILNWSDPSLSGLIFGPGLVFLLFFCMGCKVYVHLMGTLKKPCKDPLAKVEVMDLAISGENIEALLAPDVEGLNTATAQLRGLCLVQNYFESAKFAVVLYVTTTWITIFVLPTVYKQNQAKADEVFGKVKTQYESVNKKVAAMLSAQAATAQADTAQADTAPASLSSGRTRYALSALQTGSSWTGTDVLPPTTAAVCIKQGWLWGLLASLLMRPLTHIRDVDISTYLPEFACDLTLNMTSKVKTVTPACQGAIAPLPPNHPPSGGGDGAGPFLVVLNQCNHLL